MNLYISVINHAHDHIICSSDTLKNLSKKYVVVIRSNTEPSEKLRNYTENAGISLVVGEKALGFGSNNNAVFDLCKNQLEMRSGDYFLVLNPDVDITPESIDKLLKLSTQYESDISAINLFKDCQYKISDNSIRRNHKLLAPLKSLMGLPRNDIYDKSKIKKPLSIDWAAGSFLLFKFDAYEKLEGFDEKYFMYFEDVDICTRANKLKMNTVYFPTIKGIHNASLKNRKIFSIHSLWYFISLLKFHTSM